VQSFFTIYAKTTTKKNTFELFDLQTVNRCIEKTPHRQPKQSDAKSEN